MWWPLLTESLRAFEMYCRMRSGRTSPPSTGTSSWRVTYIVNDSGATALIVSASDRRTHRADRG
jgi:hypothetical protein